MQMSLHALQEIHKFNDKISGTRNDNLFKLFPIQKWDINQPQPSDHQIAAEMRSLDIPVLDGKMFKQVIMSCIRYLVINFVNFL